MAKSKDVPSYQSMYPEEKTLEVRKKVDGRFNIIGAVDQVEKSLARFPQGTVLYDRDKSRYVKKFDSPLILWQLANEYFQYTKERFWLKNEVIKSGPGAGSIIQVETSPPFTLPALLIHLAITRGTYNRYKSDPDYSEFHETVEFIEMVIEANNLEGAAIGVYNAQLMARSLGMTDKKQIENNSTVTHVVTGVTIL